MPTPLFNSALSFLIRSVGPRRALLAVLLTAPLAQAEGKSVGGLSVTLLTPELASFSRADCSATSGTEVAFRWSMGGPLIDGDMFTLFIASDESCNQNTLALRPAVALSTTSGSFPLEGDVTVKALDLFNAVSFGSGACSDPGVRQSVFACATITNPSVSSGFGGSRASGSAPILLNSKLPVAPVNLGLTPLEGGALVTWSRSPAETEAIIAFNVVATPPTGTPVRLTTPGAQNLSAKVTGLTNGVTYLVSVTAVDGAGRTGNEGPPVVGTVTPVISNDFLQLYREKDGDETGGCSSGAPSFAALLFVLLLVWRRRRAVVAPAVLGIALLASQVAAAESRKSCEELCLSLQLDTGPYRPGIDSEKGLTGTPYATTFGSDRPWLGRLTLGLGWRTGAGTFSVGVAGGLWSALGKAHSQDERNVETGDKVSFSLSSVTPLLSWRGQFIYDRWRFPLIPFVQAGYGFVSWRTEKNDVLSTSAVNGNAKGEGWGYGLEGSAGVILFLDGFDESGSTAFLHNYGLSSTGLVLSYSTTSWRGKHGLILGDNGFTVGVLILH